jgi:hydroxymethylpyrimidine/phosphomethylpyrimidine kinase
MRLALAIAATDPTAGAGLHADLKTFAAFGVYGFAVTTAVTVQSRAGVDSVHDVPPAVVAAQVWAALGSGPVAAVKLGMLATAANVRAVADALAHLQAPIVVDPVLASTGGAPLLDAPGREALVRELLPRARLVTPNLAEAAALTGGPVSSRAEMETAAAALCAKGAGAALVTGGHLAGAPADLLWEAGTRRWLEGVRVAADLHGTGCALSSGIAAGLARGETLLDAVMGARAYVQLLLESASAVPGPGRALADHLAPLRARVAHDESV